jgi:hypothetical protein
MTIKTLCGLSAALILTVPQLLAQGQGPGARALPAQVSDSFRTWNEDHGEHWHLYSDNQTGYAQVLYGGQAAAVFEPVRDEDFYALGHLAIEATAGMHGIENGTLVEDRFAFLPLGLVGSTDKVTVRFRQEVEGLTVLDGYVNTLFTPDGRLLSVQTTAMPDLLGFSVEARIEQQRAEKIALIEFEETIGLPGTLIDGTSLAIGQLEDSLKSREARLVWVVDVRWHEPDMDPEGNTYWVDALTGSVIRERPNIHHFDVGGTINTMATPGTLPDQANNPPTSLPANHARVNGGASGIVYTDANGDFNFPGVTGPINITVDYYGPWADVDNSAGGEYSLATSVNGTGNSVLMNPAGQTLITSQANALRGIGELRDYVRGVDPSDGTADFRALANVNLASSCNAYFDGSSVNFYRAGGGCPNMAYTTVITHEMGHWLNVLYGTGNGSDGMGEGNADTWAMYHWDTSEVGEDFSGPGTGGLRTGWNMLQFCGDFNAGCHGGSVHTEGQVWMGAAWKIRDNLNLTLGDAAGDAVADALFIGWMNSYNQTQIKSVIETQWLTLDDDDGNIDNGTPNYADIDAGFRTQGFPGFDLALINFQNVTELPDTVDEVGPYTVDATVTPLVAPLITGVDLRYRVNGGSFNTIAMIPMGGDVWSGSIPGQLSPAVVEYYLEGTDSLGNTQNNPSGAPSDTYGFKVGVIVVLFSDDFESGDNGWTHGQTSTEDDWQRGDPTGEGGDPSNPASGTHVWGNDLGAGAADGEYSDNVRNWLRSPVMNCTNTFATTLHFKRWLTIEKGIYDEARVKVNGTVIWSNSDSSDHVDSSWVDQELDISSIADGNSSVQIEFTLETDGSITFGGWNMDDFEVRYLGQVGGCIDPMKYGTNKANSLGFIAQMDWSGTPSETSGDFEIGVNGAIPDQFALLFSGGSSASVPFFGGFRLVGNPLTREEFVQLDNWGSTMVPITVLAGSSGTKKFYQWWYRDPGHPDGTAVGLSDGLEVLFCD